MGHPWMAQGWVEHGEVFTQDCLSRDPILVEGSQDGARQYWTPWGGVLRGQSSLCEEAGWEVPCRTWAAAPVPECLGVLISRPSEGEGMETKR